TEFAPSFFLWSWYLSCFLVLDDPLPAWHPPEVRLVRRLYRVQVKRHVWSLGVVPQVFHVSEFKENGTAEK
ncbi:MAG: hypothetical protein JRM86_04810, partial [Nitrososphaerota archaeon]|nr:hypothetical protein [Nitrososphaerota archaeon]